jgi:formylglycine-generating enzyme required for sulfatase activity
VHEVTLKPFFLSKYEMTQGQWHHLMGTSPSHWAADPSAATHPVEQVSYEDCMKALPRLGLTLPTEAQWEYGARAGTTTPWWTGANKESLKDAANLGDESFQRGMHQVMRWENWDDGYSVHAPVGSLRANGFGLFDMIGNVLEWCLDRYGSYTLPTNPDDGARMVAEQGDCSRVIRGGSFNDPAIDARCAYRSQDACEDRDSILGCRPACGIQR